MIQLLEQGFYKLIETVTQTKILTLNNSEQKQSFAWVHAKGIGEILVASHRHHLADYVLSCGKFRLYMVNDEPHFTDLLHLELLTGDGVWQGYLLPGGLPTQKEKRHRIVPTREIITRTSSLNLVKNTQTNRL